MQNPRPTAAGQLPGALGLGQAMATRIYCCFYIFYYVSPIFVAIVADSWLGQYTTLVASICLYCIGNAVLTISSVSANLDNGWGLPGLIVAMALIGLGGGGVKSILPPFIADQYTETKARIVTLKSGEKAVTDRELTLQYIYNMYFWVGNVGSLSWFATVFLEERYGFTVAYGLTLGMIIIAALMLIVGKPWYVQVPRGGDDILRKATKIVWCAVKNGWKMERATPEYQGERSGKKVSWTSHMVEELARGLRACRVLLAFVMFYVCFDQMQNNLISQAGQMEMNGTPNDLLPGMNQIACIVLGPIIQVGLYPFLHRRRIYLSPVLRISIGFMFISLSMLYATFVQHMIYNSSPCYESPNLCHNGLLSGSETLRPNVWIQTPVYFLIAAGEIFAYTTGLEYAYNNSPKDMKAIIQAINLLIAGLGSAIALALTAVAHDPNLTIFYASLSGAMAVTTFVFWLLFRNYDALPETDVEKSISPPTSSDAQSQNTPA